MKLHPRLTAAGVLLARRGERLRPRAERDGEGWVIGYGHRASARQGAAVSADDALVLLIYDLSQSAERVSPLLTRDTSDGVFDALNALAFRIGSDAFRHSDVLRRLNAGEAVTVEQVLASRDRGRVDGPSALLVAAEAVRDRLSHVLDQEPEPAPPRARRAPWPEAPSLSVEAEARPAAPASLFPPPTASSPAPSGSEPSTAADPPSALRDFDPAPRAAPTFPVEPEVMDLGSVSAERAEAPLAEEHADPERPQAEVLAPYEFAPQAMSGSSWRKPELADLPPFDRPAPLQGEGAPHAPIVTFERGGRTQLWNRLRGDPRVYMAVGACGLALFLCALLGAALGRATPMGLGLGLVGLICLAPSVAFFVARRRGG